MGSVHNIRLRSLRTADPPSYLSRGQKELLGGGYGEPDIRNGDDSDNDGGRITDEGRTQPSRARQGRALHPCLCGVDHPDVRPDDRIPGTVTHGMNTPGSKEEVIAVGTGSYTVA